MEYHPDWDNHGKLSHSTSDNQGKRIFQSQGIMNTAPMKSFPPPSGHQQPKLHQPVAAPNLSGLPCLIHQIQDIRDATATTGQMLQPSPNIQEATRHGQPSLFQSSHDNSGQMLQPSLEHHLYSALEATIRPPCPKSLLLDFIWKLPRDAPSAFKTTIFEDHPTRKLPLVKKSITTVDKLPTLDGPIGEWVEYGIVLGKADKYSWHCVLSGIARCGGLNTDNICTVWTTKYPNTDTATWAYAAAAIIQMASGREHRHRCQIPLLPRVNEGVTYYVEPAWADVVNALQLDVEKELGTLNVSASWPKMIIPAARGTTSVDRPTETQSSRPPNTAYLPEKPAQWRSSAQNNVPSPLVHTSNTEPLTPLVRSPYASQVFPSASVHSASPHTSFKLPMPQEQPQPVSVPPNTGVHSFGGHGMYAPPQGKNVGGNTPSTPLQSYSAQVPQIDAHPECPPNLQQNNKTLENIPRAHVNSSASVDSQNTSTSDIVPPISAPSGTVAQISTSATSVDVTEPEIHSPKSRERVPSNINQPPSQMGVQGTSGDAVTSTSAQKPGSKRKASGGTVTANKRTPADMKNVNGSAVESNVVDGTSLPSSNPAEKEPTPTNPTADGTKDVLPPLPTGFSTGKITVFELKSILRDHGIPYLSGTKKADAIELVKNKVFPKYAQGEGTPAKESSKRTRTPSKKHEETIAPATRNLGKKATEEETPGKEPSAKQPSAKKSNTQARAADPQPRQTTESEVQDEDGARRIGDIRLHGKIPAESVPSRPELRSRSTSVLKSQPVAFNSRLQPQQAMPSTFSEVSTPSLAHDTGNSSGSLMPLQAVFAMAETDMPSAQIQFIARQQQDIIEMLSNTPNSESQRNSLTQRFHQLSQEFLRASLMQTAGNNGSMPENQSQKSQTSQSHRESQPGNSMFDTQWNQSTALQEQFLSPQQHVRFADDDNFGISAMQHSNPSPTAPSHTSSMEDYDGSRNDSFDAQWNEGAESMYPEGPLLSNSPQGHGFETPHMQQDNMFHNNSFRTSQMPDSSNPFQGTLSPRQTQVNDRFGLSSSGGRQSFSSIPNSMGSFTNERRASFNAGTFHPENPFQAQGHDMQANPIHDLSMPYVNMRRDVIEMTQRPLEQHEAHVQQYLGALVRSHSSNALSREQEDWEMGGSEEM